METERNKEKRVRNISRQTHCEGRKKERKYTLMPLKRRAVRGF